MALSLAAAGPAVAGPNGVVHVVDGDSLEVGGVRVRLFGIDAPELDQTCRRDGRVWQCGRWSKDQVRARYEGRRARCKTIDTDRYGRKVARCFVEGQDMAEEIVRAGLATAYLRYSRDYLDAEKAAVIERAGIFGSDFEPPESYRATARQPEAPPAGKCVIKGNISKSGRIYHLPGQENYDKTRISPSKGERWFCTEAEARAAGWRRARR